MLYFCCITVVEFTFPALDLFLPRWCSDILGGHHRFSLSPVISTDHGYGVGTSEQSTSFHSGHDHIACTLKVPFQP